MRQKQKAIGVEIIDTETNESNRILFKNNFPKCMQRIATAYHSYLNSTSTRFPNGLGNGSDQVGRNIMDHHKGAGAECRR
jgi:hypothetical protein